MVYLVEKWGDVEDYIKYCRCILYRVIDHGDRVELRIKAGRLGFEGVFDKRDPELKKILENLGNYGAIKVINTVPDEVFMS